MNNKRALIICAIALLILSIFAWQFTLIILGVIALIYAINIIKKDYAYPDSNAPRKNKEVSLDFIKQEHDKEIKDNSRFEERNRNMSKSINKNSKKKKHNSNYSSNNTNNTSSSNNNHVSNNYNNNRSNNAPRKKSSYDEPLITPGTKKVLIFLSIVFLVMIIFIIALATKQNNTPFEVVEKDELVMTQEEKKKQEEKKAKEAEDRAKAKEEKEKAEEEREKEKAEEEAKKAEEEAKKNEQQNPGQIVGDPRVDTPSIVTSDVYVD